MSNFTLFSGQRSWIDALKASTEMHFDVQRDPRATEEDVSVREAERLELSSSVDATEDDVNLMAPELKVGDYLTSGADAIKFEASVGVGRGSTILSLGGADLTKISEVLREPIMDLERLPPVECIRRTIARNPDDGVITFKVSLAKHSRTVVVPEADFPAFLEYVDTLAKKVPDAIAHCRAQVEKASSK